MTTDVNIIAPLIREGITSVVLGVAGWLLLFPIKALIKSIHTRWAKAVTTLDTVQNELVLQRTNCLTTLQSQGNQQIEILEKVASTLDHIRESQVEMVGYMKGRDARERL